MMGFWYHFAIMFEALFILSAVDAVTRVARFQLSDALGNAFPKFKDPSWHVGAWGTTAVVVASWGALLLMGVTDPRGGIQTLYPLSVSPTSSSRPWPCWWSPSWSCARGIRSGCGSP